MHETERSAAGVECTECDYTGEKTDGVNGCPECGFPVRARTTVRER